MRVKNCCETVGGSIFAARHQDASQGPLGKVRVYPTECGEQLGRDLSKSGSSKSLALQSFSGEGTLWDSSLPVALTFWDTPCTLYAPTSPLLIEPSHARTVTEPNQGHHVICLNPHLLNPNLRHSKRSARNPFSDVLFRLWACRGQITYRAQRIAT